MSFEMFTAIAGAILWYKAAQFEGQSAIVWTGLSIAVSALLLLGGAGVTGHVLGQLALFPAIAAFRLLQDSRKDGSEG